ncbi:hypothetical protein EBU94_03305 [bacterium]|jgi:hypothetical protein|nr:hypothetical protein [bacterium]
MKRSSDRIKYFSVDPLAIGMHRYVRIFRNYHRRFIHSSWLIESDLNREVTINGIDYTVFGMWDNDNPEVIIMLQPIDGKGPFLLEDSKVVAQNLGYTKMRNLVTGKELVMGVEDAIRLNSYLSVELMTDEEEDVVDEIDETDELEDDQVYQDLLESIIDDGDLAAQI